MGSSKLEAFRNWLSALLVLGILITAVIILFWPKLYAITALRITIGVCVSLFTLGIVIGMVRRVIQRGKRVPLVEQPKGEQLTIM